MLAPGAFLYIKDSELKADATIVLGMTLWQRPLERALMLHRKGLAGRLIFTGGYNKNIGQTEAEAMANAANLPEDVFWVEREATNTRENFMRCYDLLKAHGVSEAAKVNIVAISFHMRRALITAQDIFPEGFTFGTASYPSIHYADDEWHLSERGRQDVQAELAKLASYYPGCVP